jgi:hypothetical protein
MNRARGGLSSFFNWAIGEGICKYNPVDKTNKSEEQSRERVLENAELLAFAAGQRLWQIQ